MKAIAGLIWFVRKSGMNLQVAIGFGVTYGDHTPQTFTRTIQQHHYLRPIPQAQIDRLDMTAEEKKAYQNPGYQ